MFSKFLDTEHATQSIRISTISQTSLFYGIPKDNSPHKAKTCIIFWVSRSISNIGDNCLQALPSKIIIISPKFTLKVPIIIGLFSQLRATSWAYQRTCPLQPCNQTNFSLLYLNGRASCPDRKLVQTLKFRNRRNNGRFLVKKDQIFILYPFMSKKYKAIWMIQATFCLATAKNCVLNKSYGQNKISNQKKHNRLKVCLK